MPVRATKRGSERTPFGSGARYDVVICGASFAGLAVARELRASRARVLVLDRYEIGERQTSACCAPTSWLVNLGLEGAIKQTFEEMVMHTVGASVRWDLPEPFSTFDYPRLCALLWEQCGEATFETAKVDGRKRNVAGSGAGGATSGSTGVTAGGAAGVADGEMVLHTDRGDVEAGLLVDCLGWRRVLAGGPEPIQPPEATLSRGLEVHPHGSSPDLQLWVDPRYVPSGYGWSFPAGDELRIGIGSYDPADHVKEPTNALSREVGPDPWGYQGNWIPHRIRAGTEDGIFFVGDSAGHCIPLSAEGIRTAFYFGIACGRELRAVLDGRQHRTTALERYGRFTADHAWKFDALLRWQQAVPRLHPRILDLLNAATARRRVGHWAFGHYLRIAPLGFALPAPPPAAAVSPARDAIAA
jgi:menaquinone-9 beta-reductase